MNSEFSPTPREELEAQITALLLGELPEAEAAALREKIAADPELRKLHTQIGMTIGLLKEAIASPEPAEIAAPEGLKLSEEKREKLLASFKVVKAPEHAKARESRTFDLAGWGALAAMFAALLVVAGMLMPSLAKSKKKSLAYTQRSRSENEFERERLDQSGEQTRSLTLGAPATVPEPLMKGEPGPEEARFYRGENSVGQVAARAAKPDVNNVKIELPQLATAEENKSVNEELGQRFTSIQASSGGATWFGGGAGGGGGKSMDGAAVGNRGFYDSFGRTKNAAGLGGVAGRLGEPVAPAAVPPSSFGFGVSPANGPVADRQMARPEAASPQPGQMVNLYAFDTPSAGKPVQDMQIITGDTVGKNIVAGAAILPAETPRGRSLGRQLEDEVVLKRELSDILAARPKEVEALKRDFGGVAVDGLRDVDGDAKKAPAKSVSERVEQLLAGRRNDPSTGLALDYVEDSEAQNKPLPRPPLQGLDPALPVAGEPVVGFVIEPLTGLPAEESKPQELAKLEKGVKGEVGQAQSKNRELEKLRRDVEIQEKIRASVAARIQQERADEKISKSGMVSLLDKAEANEGKKSILERFRGVERTARLELSQDSPDINPLMPTMQSAAYDPFFIPAEAEKIRSETVLGEVVGKLGLKEAWGEKVGAGETLSDAEAVEALKKKVTVEQTSNSGLIDIKVKSDDAAEAARIANTIAEVYQKQRSESRVEQSHLGIKALEDELKKNDELLAKARVELQRAQEKEPEAAKPVVSNPAIPQPEVSTVANPFSTFSLNVSDVSFKLAAASLEKGVMPEAGGIRSEEFINAFDYRDPAAVSAPVAFAWERARYPFAHDRDLLRFSVKTAASGREAGKPLNLVLLLDSSGSMERADRVRILRECLRVLAGQLQAQDRVSVVTFARTPRLWVDGLSGAVAARELVERVGTATPEGGTNLEEAMRVGYETAARHFATNGVNRVVLLTDGAANLGDVKPESLKKRVEENRRKGIALDCFGIGWEGLNDDLLEQLSRNGDGRYGFVNTPEAATTEFAQQLAGALKVAASDVKVQVEFNAKRATAYRQIGYAKHQLTKEQFRDNTVDAAEIGAAEAGNALYVVQVNPAGEGPIATVRVRFKAPGTNDYREHEWAVNYEGASVPLEKSTATLKLAGAASAFSEWLAASPYAGEVTPDRLLAIMSNVPEAFSNDSRPKQLEWMIRQAKSIAGK